MSRADVMGRTLPDPDSPRERARALIKQKDEIEVQLQNYMSILKANNCSMSTPLVDAEGFPRDDIDIYAVRGARVRIIELKNDLSDIMKEIAKALENVYDVNLASSEPTKESDPEELNPFARVDGVAPESPASSAGLQREDLIIQFGHLTAQNTSSGLQALGSLVQVSENHGISLRVLRAGQVVSFTLTPRKDWGGRGMLGCHIVPC